MPRADEVRIIRRLPIGEDLQAAAERWHAQRESRSPVKGDWLELVCAYGNDPEGLRGQIRVTVPPCSTVSGELIDLHDAEHLATVLPSPPSELLEQAEDPRAARAEGGGIGTSDAREHGFVLMLLAHRLERDDGGWVAHCDRPARTAYEQMLGELEAMYPDGGDPAQMARVARAALREIDGLPVLAARDVASLEPESTAGVVWRVRAGRRLVVLPLLVVLHWAVATRDPAVLDEFDAAVARLPDPTAWRDASATVRERFDPADKIVDAVNSTPGVLQSEVPIQLGLDKELCRELMWVMVWARVVRREKEGRSYRLHPA